MYVWTREGLGQGEWKETFERGQAQVMETVKCNQRATQINMARAVQGNRFEGKNKGWAVHTDRIERLLGYTTKKPDEELFARSVAYWQCTHGLKVDGIIGRNTWLQMQASMTPMRRRPQRSTRPCEPVNGKERYLLKYEAHPAMEAARARCIALDDDLFRKNFIDNFVNRAAVIHKPTGKVVQLTLYFRGGRTKVFDSNEFYKIPWRYSGRGRGRLMRFYGDIDHFLMKTDGLIYPVMDNQISYAEHHTNKLVSERTNFDLIAQDLKDLWELMLITAGFITIVASYGQAMSTLKGIRERTLNPSNLKVLETLDPGEVKDVKELFQD